MTVRPPDATTGHGLVRPDRLARLARMWSGARRVARVGAVTTVATSVVLLGAMSACSNDADDAGDELADAHTEASDDRPRRLELTIDPRTGDAPLPVRLEVRVVGGGDEEALLGCPSLAWHFGNDDVLLTKAEDCDPDAPPGVFVAEYTYRTAGSFEASAQLLASDIVPSGPVQVLIGGETPTPPAVAAVPGPTIIIATPMDASGPSRTPVPSESGQPTVVAAAPRQTPPDGSADTSKDDQAPEPGAPEPSAARVLPADLYYVSAADNLLWLLPATGDAPRPVEGIGGPVNDYAVSPAGLVAYVTDDALMLAVPGVPPLEIVGTGASSPIWSRDGRRLAYASNGVWAFDVAGYERTQLATEGEPIVWAPDGDELLLQLADGRLGLQTATASHLRMLPVGAVHDAGWMPDRDVVWLAGDGMRLLSLDDVPTLVPLIGEASAVSSGYVRPDLRLLALVDDGGGLRGYEVDLTDPMLSVNPLGPTLEIPEADDFVWAPDGRTAVVASEAGLTLLDPSTGASVPLVFESARDPLWVLRGQ